MSNRIFNTAPPVTAIADGDITGDGDYRWDVRVPASTRDMLHLSAEERRRVGALLGSGRAWARLAGLAWLGYLSYPGWDADYPAEAGYPVVGDRVHAQLCEVIKLTQLRYADLLALMREAQRPRWRRALAVAVVRLLAALDALLLRVI